MDRERFSLILLEPGEVYFEDFFSTLIRKTPKTRTEIQGHLKLCSKSVVFDPKELSRPIIKIPFKDCEKIDMIDEKKSRFDDPEPYLRIISKQYVELLENNHIAPYKFISRLETFVFHFEYIKIESYLPQFGQLHRASSLPVAEQNSMIATIVFSRHNRVKFNPLWFENLGEQTISDFPVDEINSLVVNPGRLLLTNHAIYFQSYNNIYAQPVKKIPLKSVKSLIRRRFLLRQVGLEITWQPSGPLTRRGEDESLIYVAFKFDCDRDQFYNSILHQADFNVVVKEPECMTLQWQNGAISNYDYLLYLNSCADRSFYDLTQYPVFPWILSDYTSKELDLQDPKVYRDLTKPMGAQNEDRLEKLLERFNEMPEPKFLYGSHYSAPGFVLFYLVRKFPQLMLCLCYGRFDHPDRMFNSMAEVYKNCLKNMSDFKELTPEFYDTRNKGDFLRNTNRIDFGNRSDGTPVNNVDLPGWAENSPEKFVQKLRDALESNHVSRNIHHWIDLIFGYKQRGEEAIKANNLFYYLCYEGSVDLDDIVDLAKRHALEVQISEFGQIPKQLFRQPHVPRLVDIPPEITLRESFTSEVDLNVSRTSNCDDSSRRISIDENPMMSSTSKVELEMEYQPHRLEITSLLHEPTSRTIYSTSQDGTLKSYDLTNQKQTGSVNLGSMPISSCVHIPETDLFILGCWDNSIISYDMQYCQVVNTILAHDDAVSCMAYIPELGFLITGGWDCCVKLWKGFTRSHAKSFRMSDAILAYFNCDDKINCLDARLHMDSGKINVIIGTDAGNVFIWSIDQIFLPMEDGCDQTSTNVRSLTKSKRFGAIKGILFNYNGTKIACSDATGRLVVYYVHDVNQITSNCDNIVALFERNVATELSCMNWSFGHNQLVVADTKGMLYVWNMAVGKMDKEVQLHSGTITAIHCLDVLEKRFITAGEDNSKYSIKVWKCD